ncbi:CMGC/DYRK/DYRK1 protein kinase, variant [Aphanomyces invadans]|nr:CMGC/DYRK/DYRK1 protein kinase, variant [Aphanomyces invadans]ETV97839.1 CMGC/DYRK/DYRK1 protein kinase, variant [Aphanomyces invadans]|eukprot:XP_008873400.1 CMGC/DYRK/DYRK1 protein kinase, variant [Aphanomyces invadans]
MYYKAQRERKAEKALLSKDPTAGLTKHVETSKKVDKIMAGHYVPTENEVLHGRYRITGKKLGMGTFGQVLEAYDETTSEGVAIKIIKNHSHFTIQAQTEIKILEYMHTSSEANRCHIVKLLDKFSHKGHECLVFPLCSYNLYELLRSVEFKGLGLKLIRKFAKQMIESLEFLGSVGVIHCDLKPENVVLVRSNRSSIKVVDFGSSCLSDKRIHTYIQSRFYRAPEILLGMKYSTAIDVWSVGCILVELHTGSPLFAGQDLPDQLRRMALVLGVIPGHIVEQANPNVRREYFERELLPDLTPTRNYKLKKRNLKPDGSVSLDSICTLGGRRLNKEPDHSRADYDRFVDLVSRMLEMDPARRITPAMALHHPFFHDHMPPPPPQPFLTRSAASMDKKRTTGLESTDVCMTDHESSTVRSDDPYHVCTHRAKQRKLLVPHHRDG